MSKQSMSDWARQNSHRLPIELTMTDGQRLEGAMLIRREGTLSEVLNGSGSFIEFDCAEAGTLMISKASIRTLRKFELPPASPAPVAAGSS